MFDSLVRVDSYGLADKKGLKPGDQILDVNGVPFVKIMHHHAVEILRNQMPLILIVRVSIIYYCAQLVNPIIIGDRYMGNKRGVSGEHTHRTLWLH